ncbi:MAG: YlxR family protein [Acidimicrobiales bacterium]
MEPSGRVVLGRKTPGRGAWLCRSSTSGLPKPECVAAARRRGAFSRALRATVSGAQVEAMLRAAPDVRGYKMRPSVPRGDHRD